MGTLGFRVALVAMAVTGGYALKALVERWTAEDSGDLLLYLTAIGALLAAFFAYRQAEAARAAVAAAVESVRVAADAVREARDANRIVRVAQRPSLKVARWVFSPLGIEAEIRNSGHGPAYGALFRFGVEDGPIPHPYPPFEAFDSRAEVGLESLGVGESVHEVAIPASQLAGGASRFLSSTQVTLFWSYVAFDAFGEQHSDVAAMEMNIVSPGAGGHSAPGTPGNPQRMT